MQLDLAGFLIDAGFDLIPEVPFGRYIVDLYEPIRHLAFEADGTYWHDRNERERPGYYAQRDQELLSTHLLPTVRFPEAEINQLVVKEGF